MTRRTWYSRNARYRDTSHLLRVLAWVPMGVLVGCAPAPLSDEISNSGGEGSRQVQAPLTTSLAMSNADKSEKILQTLEWWVDFAEKWWTATSLPGVPSSGHHDMGGTGVDPFRGVGSTAVALATLLEARP